MTNGSRPTDREACFLISGQIRNKDALLGMRDFVADSEIMARFVLSVWEVAGEKISGAFRVTQRLRLFGESWAKAIPFEWSFEDLFAALPSLKGDILNANRFSPEELRDAFDGAVVDIEGDNLCLDFFHKSYDSNSKRMLYKIWRANELKRTLEAESGHVFPTVIRVRPDFIFREGAAAALSEQSDKIRVSYVSMNSRVGDEIAVGPSSLMDRYASLFGSALLAPHRRWKGIHQELHDHLTERRIAFEPYNFGKIAADPQFAGLLSEQVSKGQFGDLPDEEKMLLRCGERCVAGDLDSAVSIIVSACFLERRNYISAYSVLSDELARRGHDAEAFYLRASVLNGLSVEELNTSERFFVNDFIEQVASVRDGVFVSGSDDDRLSLLREGQCGVQDMGIYENLMDIAPATLEGFVRKLTSLRDAEIFQRLGARHNP